MSFKNTLNLPHTDFPMKADLPHRELGMVQFWQDIDLYARIRQARTHAPLFVLHDGPPYANGPIHAGTALNKTLKDFINKTQILSGHQIAYVPGWDCHGLPIELQVEKKHGTDQLSKEQFRIACEQEARTQVARQAKDFQRLGVLGDWNAPYLTMNPQYEAKVIRALAHMVRRGHVYRGQKPIHWCTQCQSALAESEVDYMIYTTFAIDVGFSAVDAPGVLSLFGLRQETPHPVIFPIWTTTPWTLLSNQGIAVHPDLEYALVHVLDPQHPYFCIVAASLVQSFLHRVSHNHTHNVIEQCVFGRTLAGLMAQHPLLKRCVPLVLGEHVTLECGTGLVHTAPAHGPEDYVVGQAHQLPLNTAILPNGCFEKDTLWVGGLSIEQANPILIQHLSERGKLLSQTEIQHSHPHCWRHKIPLFFRATPQWFIGMDRAGLRAQALDQLDGIHWLPAWGQERMRNMLQERPDWCFSRQRTWGICLMFLIHKETGALHPRMPELMEHIAEHMECSETSATWNILDPEELIGSEAEYYEKTSDVLDVWLESGLSHTCVLKNNPNMHIPADIYLEGSDQYRGWFQASLLTAAALGEQPPFKTVITHGYIVDAAGFKMSKSLGNVISPSDIIQKYGADILRLFFSSVDFKSEVGISDAALSHVIDVYRRIRNTLRFLISNLYDFDVFIAEHFSHFVSLDQWVLEYTAHLEEKIKKCYAEFQFSTIYQCIHHFCSVEMGGFYLDIIKDRLYTLKANSHARRSAQITMWCVLERLVRWMAPILSFTAEETWKYIPGPRTDSVFLDSWYGTRCVTHAVKPQSIDWEWMIQLKTEVNRVLEMHRRNNNSGSSLEMCIIFYAHASHTFERLSSLNEELKFLFLVSEAHVVHCDTAPQSSILCETHQLSVAVHTSSHAKCPRCWHRHSSVQDGLCVRCARNVYENEGEERLFL